MERNNLYKKLFFLSLVVIFILSLSLYSYKNAVETKANSDKISILQKSTTVFFNLSQNMKSDDIDSDYLVEQSALFIAFSSLIPEYDKLKEPLFNLIDAIENKNISKEETKLVGEDVNLKARELLKILNLPSESESLDEVLEKYNTELNELNIILNKYSEKYN